ncbi:MAG: sulfate adenylyltransferase subunit CysN [Alphaproteobacteria bacterium]
MTFFQRHHSTASSEKKDKVGDWLAAQATKDLLRFIICGSVDDGKSTLIGRLLWDSKQVFADQIAALEADSKQHGTQGADIDFSLLVDGLIAEREQGITIDVAYRFFSTPTRKFIAADAPGHEQYSRNMFTGASTADAAIILIDARKGILTQTRRHAHLISLVGIKHVILAINKMDLVNYSENIFEAIVSAFSLLGKSLGFSTVTPIPLSALKGDNINKRSENITWYQGQTLLERLETIEIARNESGKTIFPVQFVNRPKSELRGLCGNLISGMLRIGDTIRITSSGQEASVSDIITVEGHSTSAFSPEAITVFLDRDVDVSNGDILTMADNPVETSEHFEATLVWMDEKPCMIGRTYHIKLSNQWAEVRITSIKYRIDVNTQSEEPCNDLVINDIAAVTLSLNRPIAFEPYRNMKSFGGFIIVDKFSKSTLGGGMINTSVMRSRNLTKQDLSVTREDRERLKNHKGQVVWFTGLSGSGKSTIANALEAELNAQGKHTYILDGDNFRRGLNKDLGFTDIDRIENIRRAAEVAKMMMDAGLIVLVAFISPFEAERQLARELIGDDHFSQVFIDTPIEICEQRDPKNLYKMAREQLVPKMTGIDSSYEPPSNADLTLKTEIMTIDNCVKAIMKMIM